MCDCDCETGKPSSLSGIQKVTKNQTTVGDCDEGDKEQAKHRRRQRPEKLQYIESTYQ